MRKGIIFSLDSMLAIVLLVIIAATYANVVQDNDTHLKIAELKTDEAIDATITGFYGGNVVADEPTRLNESCVQWWDYKFEAGSGKSRKTEKIICSGFS